MGSQNEVRSAGVLLGAWHDDVIADDRSEAVDLCTELDLDDIASNEDNGGLGLVGLERGIWGDEGSGRDGRWVGDT